MELTEKTAKKVAQDLAEIIEATEALYFSDKEISPELAKALGELWELSQDYIALYEGSSRL